MILGYRNQSSILFFPQLIDLFVIWFQEGINISISTIQQVSIFFSLYGYFVCFSCIFPCDPYLLKSLAAAWHCSDYFSIAWYSFSLWKVQCKHLVKFCLLLILYPIPVWLNFIPLLCGLWVYLYYRRYPISLLFPY